MKFTDLDLHPQLLTAIQEMELIELTDIQERTLKPVLEGCDVAGIAQTGTGKTIAFLMPILNRLFREQSRPPAALIITPTRELCIQITEEARKLCRRHPLKVCSLYGGEAYRRQEQELAQKPHLIVATPGRLIDYIKQAKLTMNFLRFLVLDEADRMFDMGFIRDIRFIMKKIPESTQTMLFSATLSYSVLRLARDFMQDNIVEVRIESESVAVERIEQKLIHLGTAEKTPYIVNQIHQAVEPRVIVFTNFRHRVASLTHLLRHYGIAATGISSLMNQKSRVSLLKSFKSGQCSVLVATDVASRGIDIDDLSHIFNYDLPQDAEAYVHRIGRTARAGKSGISISYCCEEDYENLPRIERFLGQKIPVEAVKTNFLKFPKNGFQSLQPLKDLESAGRPERGPALERRNTKQKRSKRPSRSEAPHSRDRYDGNLRPAKASSRPVPGHHQQRQQIQKKTSRAAHARHQRPATPAVKTGLMRRMVSIFRKS